MQDRFETFTIQIGKISRFIRKIKTEEMSELNLKSPHVSCLYYLYINKTLTSKQLCDVCDEDKGAISRSIEYLEKNEFIACVSKNEKRYNSPLVLTPKGEQAGKRIVEKINNILDEASQGLTEEKRKDFYESLILISKNLQTICDMYEE